VNFGAKDSLVMVAQLTVERKVTDHTVIIQLLIRTLEEFVIM